MIFDVKRGSFATVPQDEAYPGKRFFIVAKSISDLLRPYPCPLIKLELLNCGPERLFCLLPIKARFLNSLLGRSSSVNHLAVLKVDENGIDYDGQEGKPLNKQKSIVLLAITGAICSAFASLYCLWKVGNSDVYLFVYSLLCLCSLCSFGYCICLLIQRAI